jgi:hypothetical protein
MVQAPTGIRGFDELTGGGLPGGRATLVTGGPGSCKTLFGLEFLVRGRPGVHRQAVAAEVDRVVGPPLGEVVGVGVLAGVVDRLGGGQQRGDSVDVVRGEGTRGGVLGQIREVRHDARGWAVRMAMAKPNRWPDDWSPPRRRPPHRR